VGNKDIYQTIEVGEYKLFVTVRMPLVIPGVAVVEARSSGASRRWWPPGSAFARPAPRADRSRRSSNL